MLSADAVQRVLDQLDGLLSKRREARELREAEAAFYAAPSPEACQRKIDAGMRLAIAQADVERDRTDGWGPAGPPMTEAEAEKRDAVRRGLVVQQRRRTPRSRGAAHRPAARRTATRAGPALDDPDEPEPPLAAAAETGTAP